MLVSGLAFEESLFITEVKPTLETGGTYGVEGSYLVTILFMALIGFELYDAKRHLDHS